MLILNEKVIVNPKEIIAIEIDFYYDPNRASINFSIITLRNGHRIFVEGLTPSQIKNKIENFYSDNML